MAIYVVLGTFTEQGVRNAKDSPKRADAFKEMAKKSPSSKRRMISAPPRCR
jgi:uncharacterized protein with GYD domain